jgi:hypothetical protein
MGGYPEVSRERRGEMSNAGDVPKPEHDTFEQFMDAERGRLQKHASGALAHEGRGYA